MLKRKLQSCLAQSNAKRLAQEANRLQVLFTGPDVKQPMNVLEAIQYIKSLVIWQKFDGKVPPVVLKSQIYALINDHTQIDGEISELRCQGQIVVIKLDSGTYGLVEKKSYLDTANRLVEEQNFDKDTCERFLTFCTKDQLDVEITPKQLMKHMKEGDITGLVREGFLTSEVTGMYYLTIPNASLFLRALNEGRKVFKSIIKRAKFKEILLMEILQRKTSKKTSILGPTYYCLDLIGDQCVKLISTTSGPLLRYIDVD